MLCSALVLAVLAHPVAPPPPGFTIHVRTWPDAAFVNSVVIETARHIVLIDPGFTPQHASQLQAFADSIGKPIDAVLLTHGHIDHYGAIVGLDRSRTRIVSSRGVARQIEQWNRANYARFGLLPPAGSDGPIQTVAHGEAVVVDGVRFTLYDAGPGEAYADAWWMVASGNQRAAVIGDLAMFGLPPLMQSGHSSTWLSTLERLKHEIRDDTPVYIGHDVAAMGARDPHRDHAILDWQIARIEAFRSAVVSLTRGDRLLSEREVGIVVAELHADAPENLTDFDFIITTSANVLAAELILERQKARFEEAIQALFAGNGR